MRAPEATRPDGATLEDLAGVLRERVQGRVHVGPRATGRWATDFGRVRRCVPGLVVEAVLEDDVAHTLTVARTHGIRVAIRGAGHSCNGRTLSDGGIVIVQSSRDPGPIVLGDTGSAELPARARWRRVERELNRAGRTVPVLADYLDLTVGGTLSVGCYGLDSIVDGAQVDHVERLRLVRPDGTAVWCSPTDHADLFGASLAGLGRAGVIERAVIRTRTHQKVTALFTTTHRSFLDMVNALEGIAAAGPVLLKALHARGRSVTTVGASFDGWREALAAGPPSGTPMSGRTRRIVCTRYRTWRSAAVSLWLGRYPGYRRVWADYVLDPAGLAAFARDLAPRLAVPPFGIYLKSVYILAIRSRGTHPPLPLEAAGAIAAPIKFGIGLYCMVPSGDESGLATVQAALDGCLRHCLALGGRPYLYGAHRMDRAAADATYGPDYERLRALQQALDPSGLLRSEVLP